MGLAKCLLLLGSNIGSKKENLQEAVRRLKEVCGRIIKTSAIYLTEPWGTSSENIFLNQAIVIETSKNPFDLLSAIKIIESEMGRTTTTRWGDRIIDIDILLYENVIIDSHLLQIPHPQFQNRRFALIPAFEIASEWKHPLFHKSVEELLTLCEDKGDVKKDLTLS